MTITAAPCQQPSPSNHQITRSPHHHITNHSTIIVGTIPPPEETFASEEDESRVKAPATLPKNRSGSTSNNCSTICTLPSASFTNGKISLLVDTRSCTR